MIKKILLFALIISCFAVCSCSKPNDLQLKLIEDETDLDYIYYDDLYTVYVAGGIMMIGEDNPEMLEIALHDGTVTIKEIISAAEADVADGDIETTVNLGGTVEYHYDTFNLIVFSGTGALDVYFTPVSMHYDSLVH